MREYRFLKIEKKEDGVLQILLNRPEVRNAMNRGMREEWSELLDEAEDDADVRVVTVRGAGPVFSSGGDMKEGAPGLAEGGASSGRPRHEIPHLPRAWYFRKVIIAGVHDYVGPEALNFLGFCDFIIASSGTRFSFEQSRLGGLGNAAPILSMYLPMRVMKKLYLMGGWFDAEQALSWDFVQRVVETDELEAEVNRWAKEVCKIPWEQVNAMKQTLHRIYELKGLVNITSVGNRGPGYGAERDREFYKMVMEKGVKEALRFRDSQFDSDLSRV